MQLKTFGTVSAAILSVGAGALTQSPQYSFLALPVAIVAGIAWLIVLAVFLVRNRKHIRAWLKAMEPSHLLIVGLGGVIVFALVALVAAIWQMRRGDELQQQVASQQVEIKNLQDGLAKAFQSRAPTVPAPARAAAPIRYTAYEKEQRLRAVDEIYSVIATQLQPIYAEGNKLIDGIYRGSVPGDAEQRLTDYRNRVQAAFDNLNTLLKKYNYFPDIVQVTRKNTFNDTEATHEAGNLIGEIAALRQKAPNDMPWFLLRDTTMMGAREQLRHFEQYLSDTTKALQEKRTEIEKAEVYLGQ